MIQATKTNVTPGTIVRADGGFTCLREGAERVVHQDKDGLYIGCREWKHYLDGQLNEQGEYVGLFIKT